MVVLMEQQNCIYIYIYIGWKLSYNGTKCIELKYLECISSIDFYLIKCIQRLTFRDSSKRYTCCNSYAVTADHCAHIGDWGVQTLLLRLCTQWNCRKLVNTWYTHPSEYIKHYWTSDILIRDFICQLNHNMWTCCQYMIIYAKRNY